MLERYIQQLSEELELESVPVKDESQFFQFKLPTGIIRIKQLDPGIYFYSTLGDCPTLKKEELFILLMRANFLGQGTGGGVIGLEKDESLVTFSLALPCDMKYQLFKEALEDFSNFVDYWRGGLANHQREAEQGMIS